MIIKFAPTVELEGERRVEEFLRERGYTVNHVRTQHSRYLVAIGSKEIDIRSIGHMPGVQDVFRVSDPYKLVSRKWRVEPTRIALTQGEQAEGGQIGEGTLSLMAGPCSIETREQVEQVADHLVANRVTIMRGGIFKPRTSPYSFRGLGLEGLKMFAEVVRPRGIKIISEVLEISQIEEMYDYVDIYQVGARNTQNFTLLHALGRVDKPVLLKRGMSGTIEELLQSAEYVFSSGNEELLLCERGIRTYETSYRNTLDINAISILKEKSHLPVVVDPSHGIGVRRHVEAVALAGVMAGADGVLFEIHPTPESAASDGQQTLNFEESAALISRARATFALRQQF